MIKRLKPGSSHDLDLSIIINGYLLPHIMSQLNVTWIKYEQVTILAKRISVVQRKFCIKAFTMKVSTLYKEYNFLKSTILKFQNPDWIV